MTIISHKPFHIGIAGAGLLGRLIALNCLQRGFHVTLFDQDAKDGEEAAGLTAAGMLAPFAELETAESSILISGKRSIQLWPSLLKLLSIEEAFKQKGSLVTAHHADQADLTHFVTQLRSKVDLAGQIKTLNRSDIEQLEPELTAFSSGYFFPNEGHINGHVFMETCRQFLANHPNVTWHALTTVSEVAEGTIKTVNQKYPFDHVFDSRGAGAKDGIKGLRGVRGEVFWLDAPAVNLSRPIRLMHPRYRIYIVPRPNHRYVIGASEIESEDRSGMSVRSSLELLSAAYSVHPGFGEARIVKMLTNCRPALENNLPKVEQSTRKTVINGLYRHGYLLAPAIVEEALTIFD